MLSNHFKVSLRHIKKNRLLSFLNISGLSISIGLFMVLGLFVKHEFSYDNYHENGDKIYRLLQAKVDTDSTQIEDENFNGPVFGAIPQELQKSLPQVSKYVRFLNAGKRLVKFNNKTFQESSIFLTDPSVSQVFDLNLLWGGMNKAPLSLDKLSIYLSSSAAIKLFGDTNIQNEILELENLGDFIVAGVFEDMPENSHLAFDYLISIDWIGDVVANGYFKNKGMNPLEFGFPFGLVNTYLLLHEEMSDPELLESQIADVINPNLKNEHAFMVQPLKDIYMSDTNQMTAFKDGGNKDQASIFLYLSIAILLIAIINYTNLTTAKHLKRVKDLGIRKILGGTRANLIYQLLLESLLLVFMAFTVGVCLAESLLPSFNAYTGKDISIPYSDAEFYMISIAFVIILGVVNGLYPSIYLTKIKALGGLQKQNSLSPKSKLRQGLLVVQFICAVGLIFTTSVIKSQFNYLQNKDLGIQTEQIVRLALQGDNLKNNFPAFKEKVLSSPYVEEVTATDYRLLDMVPIFQQKHEDHEETLPLALLEVRPNFLKVLGIEFIDGTDQFLENPEDDSWFYVNEEFVKVFGMKEDGTPDVDNFLTNKNRFGGVVADFHYMSTDNKIEPLMISTSNSNKPLEAYIKIKEVNAEAAISLIERSFEEFTSDHPFEYTFLNEDYASRFESEKRLSNIFNILTYSAILIAVLGLYGMAAFMAEQRTKELGVRQVLGATWRNISWLLGKNTLLLIFLSLLISMPLTYLLVNEWLSEYPYQTSVGLYHFLLSPFIVLTLTILIVLARTKKVVSINPVTSLRAE